MAISIRATATAFPDKVIDNSYFGDEVRSTHNPMFLGTQLRRHMSRDEKASDLIARAIQTLSERGELPENREVDILLTNVAVPDELFTGCGAIVVRKAELKVGHIFDLHNTGCVSFLFMLELAEALMKSYGLNSAMICTVQTAGGRIFAQDSTRKKAQAAIPGDGCGIVLVNRQGSSQVLGSVLENFSEYSEDMFVTFDDGRKYWEPGEAAAYIDFNEAKVAKIVGRGNKLVPQMVKKVCEKVGVKLGDINWLITNQPNLHFLRNWREALEMAEHQHLHTFTSYANLFGAAIPVTLAENAAVGRFQKGDLICMAGFSHAGDYAGATLLRW